MHPLDHALSHSRTFRGCKYLSTDNSAVIDENPYEESGKNWYIPQNNFFRSVSHMIIDLTDMPTEQGTGM